MNTITTFKYLIVMVTIVVILYELRIIYLIKVVVVILIKMSITDAELEKYRTYLDEGTMDAAAQKLNMTSGAISEAIRNVERKISESIENLKIGLELELPFKRIKQEELARKLSYVFDEKTDIVPITQGTFKLLKETIELYEAKFITVEAFVNGLIKTYLKTPK